MTPENPTSRSALYAESPAQMQERMLRESPLMMNVSGQAGWRQSLQNAWPDTIVADCPADLDAEDELCTPVFGLAMKVCSLVFAGSLVVGVGLLVWRALA